MNVRIWSNYLHHTFVHIATASTSMGPLCIFRNVFGESRIFPPGPLWRHDDQGRNELPVDFRNDLTGGYLGGGFASSTPATGRTSPSPTRWCRSPIRPSTGGSATERGARSEGVDVPYCTPSCVFSRARPQ